MLLLHQTGTVKVGEVVRYTVTYTPSEDRILPSPEKLYLRIRNTSAVALRAAFVHGPYTLSVAAYPASFDPNRKFEDPLRHGVPEFEPMLKAGGSWETELSVPDDIRQAAGVGRHGTFGNGPEHDDECAKWIIEVASQVVFSASAAVGYEVVLAREQKSLNLSQTLPLVSGSAQVPQPGKLADHQQVAKEAHHGNRPPKGVFSRAVSLKVQDTTALWSIPKLPGWEDARFSESKAKNRLLEQKAEEFVSRAEKEEAALDAPPPPKKQKKVHLVILTHGLHSNLTSDMLYMKESIDAAAKQARIDAKARRARERAEKSKTNANANANETSNASQKTQDKAGGDADGSDDEDEEVVVRGYPGNAAKTEKGIKYLGKRLSRYILSMTYPDQPFLPVGKGAGEGLAEAMRGDHDRHHHPDHHDLKAAHKNSTILADAETAREASFRKPYKITSISFVGHSLGGLVQTYAVAYIQKHSPSFFDIIQPVSFIAMATPFLGLSNENPLYVKFALDFGLVGRTGKDLGLTWRAPTIARSGWGAIMSNLGETAHKKVYGETQPDSKPLLRILPTGPAHTALKKFRNRTVYSNVVNDGIVPLRTSCLLFLDWQGLGRVEKARRDAGLVETVVGFGWAELMGTNMSSPRPRIKTPSDEQPPSDSGTSTPRGSMRQVPQPSNEAMHEDDRASIRSVPVQSIDDNDSNAEIATPAEADDAPSSTPFSGFFNIFKSNEPPKPQATSKKQQKILRRGQTLALSGSTSPLESPSDVSSDRRSAKATTGHDGGLAPDDMSIPPRTTVFESAGDLLNPSIPPTEYIIDPSKRPRTIFHDRVYHPADIPSPPLKKRQSSFRRKLSSKPSSLSATSQHSANSGSSSPYPSLNRVDSTDSSKDYDDTSNTNPDMHPSEMVDGSGMRVEEKIARGYHRDLSWRKVLVKLEPDAHNNIIVRRMFGNAHGWPVIKHMVDAHFSDSEAARMPDAEEPNIERAFDAHTAPTAHGREVKPLGELRPPSGSDTVSSTSVKGSISQEPIVMSPTRDSLDASEALDKVSDLPASQDGDASSAHMGRLTSSEKADSVSWSDRDWMDSEPESDVESATAKDGKHKDSLHPAKDTAQQGRPSPSWGWAEKIVGKGATTKSPKSDSKG